SRSGAGHLEGTRPPQGGAATCWPTHKAWPKRGVFFISIGVLGRSACVLTRVSQPFVGLRNFTYLCSVDPQSEPQLHSALRERRQDMRMRAVVSRIWAFILVAVVAAATVLGARSARAQPIDGVVQGGGGPIATATVTLWAAGQGAPRKLGETSTRDDGGFELRGVPQTADGEVLYLVARGGQPKVGGGSGANDTIGLMALLGAPPPAKVVVNELTTIASVWTAAQFLEGTALSGHALGLTIAAGNVPNFVDLGTGGWGEAIQGPLNSGQTPTMANVATLADLLSGCVTRVAPEACSQLF